MADAELSFYSFVRRGLATALTNVDGPSAGSPQTTISVSVKPVEETEAVVTQLGLVGPGDIVGLDPTVVVRTLPRANDFDAEYVPYALIEFDQADLPWRYTPAREAGTVGSGTDKLRPWFSLVVVPAESVQIEPSSPTQKLPILNVNVADLPDATESWAFAHTQFSGPSLSPQAVQTQITGAPGKFVARLMSPRVLKPSTEYVACLVPTFMRGAKIGRGEAPGSEDALTTSWPGAGGVVRLPIYYSWRFATGLVGSFERLARLIEGVPLPLALGRRDMDVSDPGLDLDPPTSGPLPVEGALQSVAAFEAGRLVWPESLPNAFLTGLKGLLNAPHDAQVSDVDPVVAPPLYGQWYAADDTLNDPLNAPQNPGTNPAWFYELNSDPRERVAAALGTEVIQREQQALLAAGWDQVAEIGAVNDKLRVLQLCRGVLGRVYERHFLGYGLQRTYHLTRRVHSRVTCGPTTVCDHIGKSPIVPGFMSAQWVRWARARGPIGRVQGRPGLTGFVPDLISRLNDCKRPAPEPVPPTTHDPGDIPGGITCEKIDELSGLGSEVLLRWGLVILWVSRKLLISQNGDCFWIGLKALRYAVWLIRIAVSSGDVKRRCAWHAGTLSVLDIQNAPPMPNLAGFFASPGLPTALPIPPPPGLPTQFDNTDAAAVRAALIRLIQETAAPAPLVCAPPMNLETCRASIVARLLPEETVGLRFIDRIVRDPSVHWQPRDPLEPLQAPPEYERPMYEPLSQISYDWLLPGLNQMKSETAGLAVVNQRFIEAYMTGLNHEMTRELLWNEFPTDQRGTYFRQFWDIGGHLSSLSADELRDIEVFRQWEPGASLGENSPRPPPLDANGQPAAFLVLVVRAQLIQKYPNVIVYAQKSQGSGSSQTLSGEKRHPVFFALLKPDVAFYGFDLTPQGVRDDPSWHFVLQEQPGEPKFAEEGANLETQTFTDPEQFFLRDDVTDDPVPESAAAAGEFAKKTFQLPFRLGIQGTVMLPEP